MTEYFCKDISKFIYSAHSTQLKFDKYKNNIAYLKQKILTNFNNLPYLYQLKSFENNMSSYNYNIYLFLTYTDGELKKGFNPVNIKTTPFNKEMLFDQKISELNIYSVLHEIYKKFFGDIPTYITLIDILYKNTLYKRISPLLFYDEDINPYYYIYNFNYNKYQYNNLNYDNISVFVFFYEFFYLVKSAELFFNLTSKIYERVNTSGVYNIDDIKNQFNSYIIQNYNDIGKKLVTYFCKNSLMVGNSISDKFISNIIENVIKDDLFELSSLFNSVENVNQLLHDLNSTTIFNSIIQLYCNYCCDILHREIYETTDEYFTFIDNFTILKQQEENIRLRLIDWMNTNKTFLDVLFNTSLQYNQNPLFFVNYNYLSHSAVVNELNLVTSDILDFRFLTSLVNVTPINISNLQTYFRNNKIVSDPDCYKFIINLYFKKIINVLAESDEFKNWSLKVYQKLKKYLNKDYILPNKIKDEFKSIDDIKYIIQLIIITDILEKNIFELYINKISSDIEYCITTLDVSNSAIPSSLKNNVDLLFIDYTFLRNILISFFNSSLTSKYLEGVFSIYTF